MTTTAATSSAATTSQSQPVPPPVPVEARTVEFAVGLTGATAAGLAVSAADGGADGVGLADATTWKVNLPLTGWPSAETIRQATLTTPTGSAVTTCRTVDSVTCGGPL